MIIEGCMALYPAMGRSDSRWHEAPGYPHYLKGTFSYIRQPADHGRLLPGESAGEQGPENRPQFPSSMYLLAVCSLNESMSGSPVSAASVAICAVYYSRPQIFSMVHVLKLNLKFRQIS